MDVIKAIEYDITAIPPTKIKANDIIKISRFLFVKIGLIKATKRQGKYTKKPNTPSPIRGSNKPELIWAVEVEKKPSETCSKPNNIKILSLKWVTNVPNVDWSANPVKSKNINIYLIKFAHAAVIPPKFLWIDKNDLEPAISPKSI